MKVLLWPNLEKQDSISCTSATAAELLRLGAVPMLEDYLTQRISLPPQCRLGKFEALLTECDVLMPIGGDGTILHSVKHAIRFDKPLIGINTGRVGFLTQIEGWELDRLELLIQNRFTVEERMMLQLTVEESDGDMVYHALNDVILNRESHRLAEIGVYQQGNLVMRPRADGLIFATPTGSTGYSLSAGGSVVEPSLEVISMTAVCPYSPYNRSLVLPPERDYTVGLEGDIGGDRLKILVDGEEVVRIVAGQTVRIGRSPHKARLIHLGQRDFYGNLREKLLLRR